MNKNTDEDLDSGNRGLLEVTGKSKKLNKIIALIATVVMILMVVIVAGKVFSNKEEPVPADGEKSNETLERNTSEDRTVAGKMKEISERMLREEREAREEQQNNAAQADKQVATSDDAVNSIRQASGTDGDSDEQEAAAGTGEQKPLLKKDRILAGETLIETGTGHDEDKAAAKDDKDDLKGITYSGGKVQRITNRHFLLSSGSVLSCVLKTRIVTSYPGVTLCQLSTDIYSADGKVLLVRKGAQLTGDQQQAVVQGATRVFVNWTTITDGDVSVRIDALGTDGLGAAGVPGWVDSHFWKRFGGAIMLSFVDDLFATMKNLAAGSNNMSYDNTADSAQQMSEIALQNSINIPDTAYVNQGTVLSVIVPRNVDFSGVYKLH